MKQKIKEVIVVEGRHDTENLRKYFDCDTIETSGSHIGKKVLDQIKVANETRGVIVFTDPDSPGNRIRHIVNTEVPGCKNAFVPKKDAHTTKKVGIEHAGKEALEEALNALMTYDESITEGLTMSDMIELGLSGSEEASERRMKLSLHYHIGFGTAKTMLRRLNFIHATKEEIREFFDETID